MEGNQGMTRFKIAAIGVCLEFLICGMNFCIYICKCQEKSFSSKIILSFCDSFLHIQIVEFSLYSVDLIDSHKKKKKTFKVFGVLCCVFQFGSCNIYTSYLTRNK